MVNPDTELERIEQGESIQETNKAVRTRANRNLYKVVPVRLPADKWELIREEANALGIGPTTLARIWILDSLRKLGNNTELPDKPPQGT